MSLQTIVFVYKIYITDELITSSFFNPFKREPLAWWAIHMGKALAHIYNDLIHIGSVVFQKTYNYIISRHNFTIVQLFFRKIYFVEDLKSVFTRLSLQYRTAEVSNEPRCAYSQNGSLFRCRPNCKFLNKTYICVQVTTPIVQLFIYTRISSEEITVPQFFLDNNLCLFQIFSDLV